MDFNFFGTNVSKGLFIVFLQILFFGANAQSDELKIYKDLEWRSPIPRFQALGVNPEYLYELANEQIALLVYPEKKLSIGRAGDEKVFNNARFVSAFTVIDAPVKEVRGLIKDYASYSDVMPRTEKATIIQKAGRHSLVEYLLVFKLPVMAVKIKYVFQYTEENNGDISIRIHEGSGEDGASRWEFIPLDNGQTLLVYTTWNNLDNSGYFFKAIVNAQPGLKTTIPEISAILAIDAIKKQFIKDNKNTKSTNDKFPFIQELKALNKPSNKILPQTPVFNTEERKAIGLLSEFGMVLVLHPKRNFKESSNKVTKLEYISLINKVHTSVKDNQDMVLDFDSYVEFLPQLDQILHKKTGAGFYSDWYLKYKFGIFTLPVQFSLDYFWLGKDSIYFYLDNGDFESYYGSLYWYSIDNKNTDIFFQYTLAINIGSDLPFSLKVLNKMPRQSLLSGLFMGTSFVEPQKQWIENQKKIKKNKK